jgi:hypothetical protein
MFKKCDFILMHSPNLDRFKLTALALMRTAVGRSNEAGSEGKQSFVWVPKDECEGQRDFLFNVCFFTLCSFSLEYDFA